METVEIDKEHLIQIYNGADKKTKSRIETAVGNKEMFIPKPKLIETWEEAAKVLKLDPVKSLPFPKPTNKRQKVANANWIMDCMCEVISIDPKTGKRYEPDWNNSSEYKWYPWYTFNAGVGFRFCFSCFDSDFSVVGSRLVFPTKDLSDHFGKVAEKYKNEAFTL